MGPAKREPTLKSPGAPRSEKANRGDARADGSASAIWDFDCQRSFRFVPERSRVLLHRAVRDARLPAHNMPAVTCLERRHQLIPITFAEFRSAQDLALCARAFEASLGPLTDLFAPELWQRGEGRQEEISGSISVDKCSSVNDRNATPCQARRCRCPTVAAMPSRLKRSSDHTSERLRERRFVLPL